MKLARTIVKVRRWKPLFLAVMAWDIFFPSRISHFSWLAVFPFIGLLWLSNCRHWMRKTAMAIILFGASLNCIALLSNAGMMPVDRPDRLGRPRGDKSHVAMSSLTHCRYLSDIFYIGFASMSIGDIILLTGVPLLIVGVVLQRKAERCS